MAFGEWLDFWYQNYSKPKLRPTTQMGYENAIYKHIIPVLGKIPMNTYTHVTDAMRQTAAAKIDRGIGKCEPRVEAGASGEGVSARSAETRREAAFEPYKGKTVNGGPTA